MMTDEQKYAAEQIVGMKGYFNPDGIALVEEIERELKAESEDSYAARRLARQRLRKEVIERDGSQCWYCGVELVFDAVCLDHVVAKTKGGLDAASNRVCACNLCNSTKGTKTVEEYRHLLIAQSGGTFTDKQRDFWERHGVELPRITPSMVPVFHGEKRKCE